MEDEKDYVWISKIYDVIALQQTRADLLPYQLLECGITQEDMDKMRGMGLYDIEDNKIVLKKPMLEYIKPETLRSNWIHLDKMVRRRFLNKSAIPTIVDIVIEKRSPSQKPFSDMKYTQDDPFWRSYNSEKVAETDTFKKCMDWYEHSDKNSNALKNIIKDYHRVHGSLDFLIISHLYLGEKMLQNLNKAHSGIHVINTNESCPLGLNKKECESYWRQEEGMDLYAYKDFTINEVPVRLHLSRSFTGVFFEIPGRAVQEMAIDYGKVLDVLREDEVLELIRESPEYKDWDNVWVYKGIIVFRRAHGFLPIFHRKIRGKRMHSRKKDVSSCTKEVFSEHSWYLCNNTKAWVNRRLDEEVKKAEEAKKKANKDSESELKKLYKDLKEKRADIEQTKKRMKEILKKDPMLIKKVK